MLPFPPPWRKRLPCPTSPSCPPTNRRCACAGAKSLRWNCCGTTLARVERLDPQVNAVVVRDFDRALERARAADAALARGEHWGCTACR